MSVDSIELYWSDCIVVFNSLIRSVEELRILIAAGDSDDDWLYDAEEELNDYLTLLARLKTKYAECSNTGEFSKELDNKLKALF